MNHPFRLYGRIVEVYRFQVNYIEERPDEEGAMQKVPVVQRVPTREEADAVATRTSGTVTALDTTAYEWLDGLEMPDVPDTYGEAIKVYEMGQAAYEQKIHFETNEKNDQLRADLDFISLMTGVSL